MFSVNAAFMDHDAGYINEQPPQGLSDMGFLQTTIYTVVGECNIYCTSDNDKKFTANMKQWYEGMEKNNRTGKKLKKNRSGSKLPTFIKLVIQFV
jgi:hypothetical protein